MHLNFRQTDSKNLHHTATFSENKKGIVILDLVFGGELSDGENLPLVANAARITCHVAAYISNEVYRPDQAPKYQSLEADVIVFLNNGEAYFMERTPRKEIELKVSDMQKFLGKKIMYPILATLKCQKNQVLLDLGGDREYCWSVTLSGGLYKGRYD